MGSKLDSLIDSINRDAKEQIITRGLPGYEYTRIPFTSPRMNYITYGGIPTGKLIELYGEEGGGKTTTALDIVANYQRLYPDREVLYIDAENTLDAEWARKIGVDIDQLVLLQPKEQAAEVIFQIIQDATETGEVGLWVLDSIPCLRSKDDLEKDLTDSARVAGISGILTRFLRNIVGICAKNDCTGVFINQIRDKLNSPIPGLINTPGGKALKHFCIMRLEFRKGSYMDDKGKSLSRSSGEPNSQQIMVNMVKTKSCKPSRHVGYYTINYDIGIDYLKDLFEMALKYDIINQQGSWFRIVDTETGEVLKEKLHGQSDLLNFLSENDDVVNRIKELLQNLAD